MPPQQIPNLDTNGQPLPQQPQPVYGQAPSVNNNGQPAQPVVPLNLIPPYPEAVSAPLTANTSAPTTFPTATLASISPDLHKAARSMSTVSLIYGILITLLGLGLGLFVNSLSFINLVIGIPVIILALKLKKLDNSKSIMRMSGLILLISLIPAVINIVSGSPAGAGGILNLLILLYFGKVQKAARVSTVN